MKYIEFRDQIGSELRNYPNGRTWKELKAILRLPYNRPCPTWISKLEKEIGLKRIKRRGRELVWEV